jgi:hypothetical protein
MRKQYCNLQWLSPLLLTLMLVSAPGCAGKLDVGADPVEVRAEQAVKIAKDSLDYLVKLDDKNWAILKEKAPEVRKFVNYLREPVGKNAAGKDIPRGQSYIDSVNQVRKVYKSNRSEANQASLNSALATLAATVEEISKHTAKAASALK